MPYATKMLLCQIQKGLLCSKLQRLYNCRFLQLSGAKLFTTLTDSIPSTSQVYFQSKTVANFPLNHTSLALASVLSTSSGSVQAKSSTDPTFFVTTPIFYINAPPHIGHLYSALLADAAHRWHLVKHPSAQTMFSTGTDEHGAKIEQAAARWQHLSNPTYPNDPVQSFCDHQAQLYRDVFNAFGIAHTRFVRTTEPAHHVAVQRFWETLVDAGYIYKGSYSGWYCVADECYYKKSELVLARSINEQDSPASGAEMGSNKAVTGKDGSEYLSPTGRAVEWHEETNYMFRLGPLKDEIKQWLCNNDIIYPTHMRSIVINSLDSMSDELSVSRPSTSLQSKKDGITLSSDSAWGIAVPGDKNQTIYVWLDALINYLTVAGYPNTCRKTPFLWPPDVQIVGKDILKFHAIYWPAFLIAASKASDGLRFQLPKRIYCHAHWMVENEKMSKTTGNIVDPWDVGSKVTHEGLRYFLIRFSVPHRDQNFDPKMLLDLLNNELANGLGNLVSRALRPKKDLIPHGYIFAWPKQFDQTIILKSPSPVQEAARTLIDECVALPDNVAARFDNMDFFHGIDAVFATVRAANLLYQVAAVWKRKGDSEDDVEYVQAIDYLIFEALRMVSIHLLPIVPELASDILNRLSIPECERCIKYAEFQHKVPEHRAGKPVTFKKKPVFMRLEDLEM